MPHLFAGTSGKAELYKFRPFRSAEHKIASRGVVYES